MVEKTDHGYVSLGTETAVESNAARDRILRVAPAAEHEAKPKNVILDEAKVKYHTGHTVLSTLVNGGELRRKGEGKRGDPHRFWRPDPPGDDQQGTLSVARKESMYQQKENGGEKHSVGTPNRTDRKKASNGKRFLLIHQPLTQQKENMTLPRRPMMTTPTTASATRACRYEDGSRDSEGGAF